MFIIIKSVAERRTRLDAAGARKAVLKNRRDEASASTATYRKELLQRQKSMETVLKKVIAS